MRMPLLAGSIRFQHGSRTHKAALKDFGARTRDALDQAIQRAMDLVGADDAQAWFRHWGYEAPGK